jgi:hypothetical protein
MKRLNYAQKGTQELWRYVPQSALELSISCQLYDHKADPLCN